MKHVAIVTAFWGRLEVAREFLRHLDEVSTELFAKGIALYLVAAISPEDDDFEDLQEMLDHARVSSVRVPNRPLCRKFNAAARAALDAHNSPDVQPGLLGIIATGSDDFISARYIEMCVELALDGAEFVAAKDIYFWNRSTGEWFHWTGYEGPREGEPIGAGRFLSTSLLDRLCWKPWPDAGDRGLDGAMWNRLEVVSATKFVRPMHDLGPIVDVKDADNMTSWGSIRHGRSSVEKQEEQLPEDCPRPFRGRSELSTFGPYFLPRCTDALPCALAMIAKVQGAAEVRQFRRALFSVVGICSAAYILFDDRSDPEAVSMAEALGCRVSTREWTNDFSAARNVVADFINEFVPSARWLLVLDADEELSITGETIYRLMGDEEVSLDGIAVPVHIWTDEGYVLQPRSIRLYRPGRGRWERAVHNQIKGLVKVGYCDDVSVSTSYQGVMTERAQRQLPALMEALSKDPQDMHTLKYLYRALHVLEHYDSCETFVDRILELYPDEPKVACAWLTKASLLRRRGNFAGAFLCLADAARRHSLYPDIWRHLMGLCLMAWTGAVETPSAYDGISRTRVNDAHARAVAAAEILNLPVTVKAPSGETT